MRALIVSCVFPPEPVTSASTSADLAAGLVQAGHDVSVIAPFPSRPSGRRLSTANRSFRDVETTAEGYRVIRTISSTSPNRTVLQQLLENISFGVNSTLNSVFEKADVVYANTWPLFAADMLSRTCRARRIPLLTSIQDIHPEAAVTAGKLSAGGLPSRLLKWVDRGVARRSSGLVVIAEHFAEFYESERGISRDRIHVVPNWMDESLIAPGDRLGPFREAHGIAPEQFVVMYAGNVGSVAGVDLLIDAAAKSRDDHRIRFVIAGDGSERERLQARVAAMGLSNILFHCPWHRDEFSSVHAAADLFVLPTRRSAAMTSVPSKLIAYMLAGRPIIAAVDPRSPTAGVVHDAQAGACIEPECSQQLLAHIHLALERPDLAHARGLAARQYAMQHFSRKVCVPKLVSILEELASKQSLVYPKSQGALECKQAA